eukprot:9950942-Alexandrium_andersonii.AAC.1
MCIAPCARRVHALAGRLPRQRASSHAEALPRRALASPTSLGGRGRRRAAGPAPAPANPAPSLTAGAFSSGSPSTRNHRGSAATWQRLVFGRAPPLSGAATTV